MTSSWRAFHIAASRIYHSSVPHWTFSPNLFPWYTGTLNYGPLFRSPASSYVLSPAPPRHFNVGLLAVSPTPMLFPALGLCLWALRKAGSFHTHGSVYIWAQERGPCISTLFVFFIILNTVSFPFSSSTPLRCRLCVLLVGEEGLVQCVAFTCGMKIV